MSFAIQDIGLRQSRCPNAPIDLLPSKRNTACSEQRESPGLRACKRESAPAATSSARRNPACAPRPAGSLLAVTPTKLKSHPQAGWLFNFGGAGGNRTRVQKHSTDSSTYLVLPFDLTLPTRTHTLRQGESPRFNATPSNPTQRDSLCMTLPLLPARPRNKTV